MDNVVAIGNAAGFVEPLEATAIMITCRQCEMLVEAMRHSGLTVTPSMRDLYNRLVGAQWDEIRDFLALHYKLNTLRDTPFWRHCRADTDLSGIEELLQFYNDNGPSGLGRYLLQPTNTGFGIEGFLVMLVGNRVAHRGPGAVSAEERRIWEGRRQGNIDQAKAGLTVAEALRCVRDTIYAMMALYGKSASRVGGAFERRGVAGQGAGAQGR